MKKIGILTLSSAVNYGATLQCFSLVSYFNEKQNIHAQIINYTPDFMVGRYDSFKINKESTVNIIKSFFANIMEYKYKKAKLNKFTKFWNANLCLTESVDSQTIKKYANTFDKYVVGSDQVWNLSLTNGDTHFFFDFCDISKEKYSYAASLGGNDIPACYRDAFKRYCSEFKAISIREYQGLQEIKKVLVDKDMKPKHVIDPVFLHNREFWISQCNKNINEENYILIYMFKNKEKGIKLAKKINCDNKKIIMIGSSLRKHKDGIYYYRDAGPTEFLSLFCNADYIITDSFHGLAFSIIFEKKFTVFPYEGTSSRMENLLKISDLVNRMYNKQTLYFDFNTAIDYENVKIKMKKSISASEKFIEEEIINTVS